MCIRDSLDTIQRIATPEGCEIDLRVAGPVARARAWFLDFLVRFGVWLLLAIAASAVSYTHLDVYKRQSQHRQALSRQTQGKELCDQRTEIFRGALPWFLH